VICNRLKEKRLAFYFGKLPNLDTINGRNMYRMEKSNNYTKIARELDMLAYKFSTQEAEATGSKVQSHHGLHTAFQANLGHTVRPFIKKQQQQ
jgi:hypothetical protein